VVGKHSWENIPKEDKGEGKFYRKATPGGWREDLTPEQVRTVEEKTAPLLMEFYPDDAPWCCQSSSSSVDVLLRGLVLCASEQSWVKLDRTLLYLRNPES
jgi:hypothetical protein